MASAVARLPPTLLARWLAWRERLRRAGRIEAIGVATLIVALAVAAIFIAGRFDLTAWPATLRDYWLLIFALATLHSSTSVARRHRRAVANWPESWLAAAPLPSASVRLAHAIDSFTTLVVQYLPACFLLLAIAAAGRNLHAAKIPLIALTVGCVAGSIVAWRWPGRHRHETREASRYTPSMAATASALQPSDRALSHWPIARAISTGRPENARLLFLFVTLFAMQSGISALEGLVVLLLWTLAGYLVSLLIAVVSVANEAARWLRSTPLRWMGFALPLVRRALLHQAIGTTIAAAGTVATGVSWLQALSVSGLWLILVIVTSSVASLLSYRP